ncbi:MAG: competence/damage-inducible protein A [Ignavibacteria bacterium]|nr:competence/damage-inducible protein A [Ignavibacteria bacterium]
MLRVSVLSVGDEICIGQVVDTNSAWIASRCVELGAYIIEQVTVRDDINSIVDALRRLYSESDIVLITGGLGPTVDDLTKPALTNFFEDTLIFSEEVFRWITDFLAKRGIEEVSDINKSLAYIPKTCVPLRNEVGTAPGLLFKREGKVVVALPGVPKEMQNIMLNFVLPLVKEEAEKEKDLHVFQIIQTCGITESAIVSKLRGIEELLGRINLAYLPSYKGVKLRVEAKEMGYDDAMKEIDVVKKFIYERIGDFVYGEGESTLSEAIGKILAERNETVSVAESCTGGLLGAEFTSVSGSSNYFLGGIIAYSNDVKINLLGVNRETLLQFGAVSEQTAHEMASNVRNIFGSTYGISITGIAGPTGGSPQKPVGTVFIGLATEDGVTVKRFGFGADRFINRERSVGEALAMLFFKLKKVSL